MVERFLLMPVDLTINDLMRFWAFTDRRGPDECWLWTGFAMTQTDKYGSVMGLRGKFGLGGKVYYAHRVAYYFEYRIDPGIKEVCHECNQPLCVNPGHLFLGTHSDNMKHRADSNRHPIGSNHPRALIAEHDVVLIRQRIAAGESSASIARSLDVKVDVVKNIKRGLTWRHVP